MSHLLTAQEIYASYHKKEILHGVSLEVGAGEIVALIGPNGAGKSTLLKVIAGALPAKAGTVIFNDHDVTHLPQFERARRGIGYLIQGGEVFPSLTVEQNLNLGGTVVSTGRRLSERSSTRRNGRGNGGERLEEVLALFPDLKAIFDRRAGLLSGGQRQMLAIGVVLMNQHPDLFLLLDEPSAGLAPKLVEMILGKILDIRDHFGTSILLVEQNIRKALEISDRVFLLKNGSMIGKECPRTLNTEKLEEIFFS
jgi:branched-chain amino acid transport system ATP-binding protein